MIVGYFIVSIILFLLIYYLEQKIKVRFFHEVMLVLIYFLVVAGIFYEFGISTYYLYVVMLVVSMIEIFLLYDKELSMSRNPYSFYRYLFFVLVVYLMNRLFIDRVKGTFLSLEELKTFVWILVILYLYWYGKSFLRDKSSRRMISKIKTDYLMIQYVHFKNKYHGMIQVKNRKLISLIYAIVLYENIKRPLFLRKMDVIFYRLDGIPRKFGVMQIRNRTVLSDEESIRRGIRRIVGIDKRVSLNLKEEQRNVKILEKYHYKKEEVMSIMNILEKINLFEIK